MRLDFWDYDPMGGWWVYGHGTVSGNGMQVIPARDVEIHDFDGAMINSGDSPPPDAPPPDCSCSSGDPVDNSTGLFVFHQTDLSLPDVMLISVQRTYRPNDPYSHAFGIGSPGIYDGTYIWSATQVGTANLTQADLVEPDGTRNHFVRTSPGTGYIGAVFQGVSPGAYYHSILAWNGNGWDLTLKNGTVLVYGVLAPLQAIRDRNGNTITITRTNGQMGNIVQVTSPNGRWIHFTYDSGNRVISATDNAGRTVTYDYFTTGPSAGYLWRVHDANGHVTTYSYNASGDMTSVTDPRGITYVHNQFDSENRVIRQVLSDGGVYTFKYTGGTAPRTVVTDPHGDRERFTFDAGGFETAEELGWQTADQSTYRYLRSPRTHLVQVVEDPLGRRTAYTYDQNGNITKVTKLAGTRRAVVYQRHTYDPVYSNVTSSTDAIGRKTTDSYDANGNLIAVADPLGHTTRYRYDGEGERIAMVDALGHKTRYGYTLGQPTSTTDALGRTWTRFVNAAGNVIQTADPSGDVTRYVYDNDGNLLKMVDPLGGTTAFGYNLDGDLISVRDPGGHTSTYAHDAMDRMIKETDPRGHLSTFAYNGLGDVTKSVDSNGHVTTRTYDSLNRPRKITFADGSTLVDTYDKDGRLVLSHDSRTGAISWVYDDLDRLTRQTTPQGSISYAYNLAGDRTAMNVAGQPAVTYSYDKAGRLSAMEEGGSRVAFQLDAAGRRTAITLPDDVTESYRYDRAGEVTGITYQHGSNVLGNLSYGYDADGRVTSEGGAWARTTLPSPIASATYNAGNELTSWGGTHLTYDANGSLIANGQDHYTWNARGQLTGISGGANASFTYDALGQRTKATIDGSATSFLYDGPNVTLETTGSSNTGVLEGPGIDQYYAVGAGRQKSSLLSDRLGSTTALAGSTGSVSTTYTYGPFGAETSAGAASRNTIQFAGMQNEGTGMYYDNARYYSPMLDRFVSKDPLGFGGGSANLYAYVSDAPTSLTDPLGLCPAPSPLPLALLSVALD